jgi:hypothetical protein
MQCIQDSDNHLLLACLPHPKKLGTKSKLAVQNEARDLEKTMSFPLVASCPECFLLDIDSDRCGSFRSF